ncbi:hypothetical protein [Simiaoa sp.]
MKRRMPLICVKNDRKLKEKKKLKEKRKKTQSGIFFVGETFCGNTASK